LIRRFGPGDVVLHLRLITLPQLLQFSHRFAIAPVHPQVHHRPALRPHQLDSGGMDGPDFATRSHRGLHGGQQPVGQMAATVLECFHHA
jgi:hypothetical protein